ncbi:hypothetical protein [Mucilaginibacter paludis]|uniref:Uncharacterized protein n=1 Tax=Mucilaginibacter paludis DSM 18603 TaxID=714943 RepID=H1Y4D6_9SPHI|nr:hypothetical protein [Mucilaginibacter paludis]EHQ25770.1 hypothetical protein Mucpa_1613 [Mucilaginibacter paludis DSM 18603]
MDAAMIRNIGDLKSEIIKLKQEKTEQEAVIKQHFSSPRAILGTVTALFSRSKNSEGEHKAGLPGQDLAGWLSRIILPFTLNKTLFRRSNFMVKALVGLLSQKASGLVNDQSVASFWDKIKSAIPHSIIEKFSSKKPKPVLRLLSRKVNDQKLPKQLR